MQDYINIQLTQAPKDVTLIHAKINTETYPLDFAILTDADKGYHIYAIFVPRNRVKFERLTKEMEEYAMTVTFCDIPDDANVLSSAYKKFIIFDFMDNKLVRIEVLQPQNDLKTRQNS